MPGAAFSADVSAFFADAPNEVVFGSYATRTWFNRPDEGVLGDSEISTEYSIEYEAAALPGLAEGSAITVDGDPFTVRKVIAQDDGAVAIATLKA